MRKKEKIDSRETEWCVSVFTLIHESNQTVTVVFKNKIILKTMRVKRIIINHMKCTETWPMINRQKEKRHLLDYKHLS